MLLNRRRFTQLVNFYAIASQQLRYALLTDEVERANYDQVIVVIVQ
jgi:hypothetical protein